MKSALAAVTLALAGVCLTGCSAVGNAAGQPAAVTTTVQQARAQGEALLDDTIARVQPAMGWQASTVQLTPNYAGIDGHYDGTARVVVGRYAPVKLASSRLPALEGEITSYWRQQGFKIQTGAAADGNFSLDATKDLVHLVAGSNGPGGLTISADVGTVKGPANIQDLDSVLGSPSPYPTGVNGSPIRPTPSDNPYWSH